MRYLLTLMALLFSAAVLAQSPAVKTGIEVLRDNNFDVLAGKRVGLITNPTGVDRNLKSTVDILYEAEEVDLRALYGPEHGVRGNFYAGDKVEDYTDPATGLPVMSLYGKTRKPTPEMLEGLDALVFDIQDIGCRSYTYISTMGLAMEAAHENGLEFIVLDRPNPLGGNKIEGNLVEDGFYSFVSQYNVPYVHGMTVGELAQLFNNEGLLEDGVSCNLTIVPMEGWTREMYFADTGLPWVLTSPHIPYKETPLYYVSTGVLGELQTVSEGVGYTIPFQTYVADWIDGEKLAKAMNALELEGVWFRPITIKPYYGRYKGTSVSGVQIYITEPDKVNLMGLQFRFLEVHHQLYPGKNPFEMAAENRIRMFDWVAGSSKVRELFSERMKYSDVEPFLNKDIDVFRSLASQYYLY